MGKIRALICTDSHPVALCQHSAKIIPPIRKFITFIFVRHIHEILPIFDQEIQFNNNNNNVFENLCTCARVFNDGKIA